MDCKLVWLVDYYEIKPGHMAVLYDTVIFDPTSNEIVYSCTYYRDHDYVTKKVYTLDEILEDIKYHRNKIYY
jgi:hypothetical protein